MKKIGAASTLGILALIIAVLGVATVVITTTLARYEVTEKISSVSGVLSGGQLLALGVIVSLIALVVGLVTKVGLKKSAVLGLVISGGSIAFLASQIVPGMSAPGLHDISTDLENPPEFQTLPLREDNLVPFSDLDGWREAHLAGYPDIAPITVSATPAQVIEKATELSQSRGWTLAVSDPVAGRMEATSYASWIKFNDDVVIRATELFEEPAAGEEEAGNVEAEQGQPTGETRVDMRSTSQVGVGDLGYNAARVEEFLGALEGAFAD